MRSVRLVSDAAPMRLHMQIDRPIMLMALRLIAVVLRYTEATVHELLVEVYVHIITAVNENEDVRPRRSNWMFTRIPRTTPSPYRCCVVIIIRSRTSVPSSCL